MKNYLLESHRGVACEYPDNTLVAFAAARAQGYDMIELDTKFTRDNRCVILHNKTINHTARRPDGSALEEETPISALTLAEARAYDYGLWRGEQFRGEPIPTLEEALAFSRENNIPLKFDNVLQKHTEEQLAIFLDTIERENAAGHVGFTGNSPAFLARLHARFPTTQLHYDGPVTDEAIAALMECIPPELLTVWLRYPNKTTAWCKTPPATPELCEKTHRYAKVGMWLLQTPEELAEALAWGADIIETDGRLKPQASSVQTNE